MNENASGKTHVLAEFVKGRHPDASRIAAERDSKNALNFEDDVCFIDGCYEKEGSRVALQMIENETDVKISPDYMSLVPRKESDDESANGKSEAEMYRISPLEHLLQGHQMTCDLMESDSIADKVEKPLLSMVTKMEIMNLIRSARSSRKYRNKRQLERSLEFLKQVVVEGEIKWLTPVLLAALLGAAAGGLAPFAIVYCKSRANPTLYAVHHRIGAYSESSKLTNCSFLCDAAGAQIGCYTAATLAALAGAGFASSMATNLTHSCCAHQDCMVRGVVAYESRSKEGASI